MFGFLLQWPTIITLLMFPLLMATYVKLAHREEQVAQAMFGDAWRDYAQRTPRWIPRVLGEETSNST